MVTTGAGSSGSIGFGCVGSGVGSVIETSSIGVGGGGGGVVSSSVTGVGSSTGVAGAVWAGAGAGSWV